MLVPNHRHLLLPPCQMLNNKIKMIQNQINFMGKRDIIMLYNCNHNQIFNPDYDARARGLLIAKSFPQDPESFTFMAGYHTR
jgi:hypothetical protein